MKNKKAIIILCVLILLFLIGGVSANDINTTEISASDTEDVTSTDNDNLNDNEYLSDESGDLDGSEIISVSSDKNSSVQNELDNSNDDEIDDICNSKSVSSKSNVLSVSEDNILSQEITTYDSILGTTKGATTITATITSSNTVSVSFTDVYKLNPDRLFYVKYGSEVKYISGEQTEIDRTGIYLLSGQGTLTFSSSFSPGITYLLSFYGYSDSLGYMSVSYDGKTYYTGMDITLSLPKPTPTVGISTSSITYAASNQIVSGTVKSDSTNVNDGTVTIKYNGNSIGSGSVTNGKFDVSIDSKFASPSTTGYSITAEYSGSSSYDSASKSGTLKVNKITPTISVGSQSVYYGQTNMPTLSGTVYSTTGNYYSGTLDLYINNVLVKSSITVLNAGSWSYTLTSLPDLSPGSYDVKVVYSGGTFASGKTETISKIYTVLQNEPTVTTGTYSVYYGQLETITVSGNVVASNVANGYGGKINVTIGTQFYNDVTVNDDGSWSFTVLSTQFNPDTYDIKMEYGGNTYCKNKTITAIGAYVVKQNDPDIRAGSITISYGQANNVTISGTVKNSNVGNVYGGTVNITIGDATWNNVLVNDDGSWSLPSFNSTKYVPNTYDITVSYSGNNYVKSKSAQQVGTLTVNKGMLFVMVTNNGNIDLGDSEVISVTVMNYLIVPLENIYVKITGDGISTYLTNTTNSEGKLTFSVEGLPRGQYTNWELEIRGNDYYEDYPFNYPVNPFNVQSPLNVFITNFSPNNSTFPDEIIVTGYTDADQVPQGNVTINIGDENYTGFFDATGNFTASLIGVKPGVYNNIIVKYNPTVDEFYYRGVESTVSVQETGD